VIVADTSAVVALLDRRERNHSVLRTLHTAGPDAWLLPWAILPEVDYLVETQLGSQVQRLWLADLAAGRFAIEWGRDGDLPAALALVTKCASLDLGLVDAVVMTIAERLHADIATLDLRDFGAVTLKHASRLLPRDLPRAAARRR
jgi:predicted nucleic acid-binding protein